MLLLAQKQGRLTPQCEANIICGNHNNAANQIHHKAGRVGKNADGIPLLIAHDNFLGVCQACHSWIEVNRKEAIKLGFSKYRNRIG